MPAILNTGRTKLRDALRGLAGSFISHVGIATDNTAFDAAQTVLDPAAVGAANLLIKSASFTAVDGNTLDVTMAVDGDTEFTGKVINTIGLLYGAARGSCITRSLRGAGLGIGVQAGDAFNIGSRVQVLDSSP